MTTPDNSQTQTQQPTAGAAPTLDPIDQARQLINMLSLSRVIKQEPMDDESEDYADERTLVLASVGIAIAHHIARIADAIEAQRGSHE